MVSGSIDHRSLRFLTPQKMLNVETEHLKQLVSYLDNNLPAGKMFNQCFDAISANAVNSLRDMIQALSSFCPGF